MRSYAVLCGTGYYSAELRAPSSGSCGPFVPFVRGILLGELGTAVMSVVNSMSRLKIQDVKISRCQDVKKHNR